MHGVVVGPPAFLGARLRARPICLCSSSLLDALGGLQTLGSWDWGKRWRKACIQQAADGLCPCSHVAAASDTTRQEPEPPAACGKWIPFPKSALGGMAGAAVPAAAVPAAPARRVVRREALCLGTHTSQRDALVW